LTKRIKAGELVYGGLVSRPEMPTYKCLTCQNRFAVGQRTSMILFLARLACSIILAIFVGYYAASATIVSDSVAQSAISQLISASIAPRAVTVDLVMWVLGMLAVIGLLVVGGITKSKTIVSSGLGYVVGFLYSAWILNAWWTIMLEACMLLLFLLSFAILSE
jgi:hypothetical protein